MDKKNGLINPEIVDCPEGKDYCWVKSLKCDKNFQWEGELIGKAVIKLTTKQNVHIGSGDITKKDNKLYQALQRCKNMVIIPGSSIKGAIRHYMNIYFSDDSLKNIFGSKEEASKIYFSDAMPLEEFSPEYKEIEERYGPRRVPAKLSNEKLSNEVIKLYKDSKMKADQSSELVGKGASGWERIEVIPPEKSFGFEMVFKGVTTKALGALFYSVGMGSKFRHGIKIGGAKAQSFGLVALELNEKGSYYFNGTDSCVLDTKQNLSKDTMDRWCDEFYKDLESIKEIKEIKEWFISEYRIN